MNRLERDTDPALVAEAAERRKAWADRLGHPKRCETNQVHPGLGCCLYCCADMGENCRLTRKPAESSDAVTEQRMRKNHQWS